MPEGTIYTLSWVFYDQVLLIPHAYLFLFACHIDHSSANQKSLIHTQNA